MTSKLPPEIYGTIFEVENVGDRASVAIHVFPLSFVVLNTICIVSDDSLLAITVLFLIMRVHTAEYFELK